MSFTKQLPEWQNSGNEPPASKITDGWGIEEKPPADWFNWLHNKTYEALQEMQQKALEHQDNKVYTTAGTDDIIITTNKDYEYINGIAILFTPVNTNTGAMTIDINSLGATSLKKEGGTDLIADEIQVGKIYLAYYDSSLDIFIIPEIYFDEPLYLTESFTSSIFSLSEATTKGQVSVGLSGRTYSNPLGSKGEGDSLDGWSYSPTYTTIENGFIKHDYSTTAVAYVPFIAQSGDKIYFSTEYYGDGNALGTALRLVFTNGGSNVTSPTDGLQMSNDNTNLNKISDIFTLTGNCTEIKTTRSGVGGAIFFKHIIPINLTQLGLEDLTKEECDNLFPYITGTKSTVCAIRQLSHSKNFLKYDKDVSESGYGLTSSSLFIPYKVPKNIDMFLKLYNANIPSGCSISITDKNENLLVSRAGVTGDQNMPFNTGDNDTIYLKFYNSVNQPSTYDYGQLELGTSATDWVKYDESISYIYAEDENGDIIEAHSLPNGVKDEVSDGKVYKNTNKVILDGNLSWGDLYTQTNVYRVSVSITGIADDALKTTSNSGIGYSSDGSYPVNIGGDLRSITLSDTIIYLRIEQSKIDERSEATILDKIKGYLNEFPITLIYQLAEEKIYDLPVLRDIYSFDGETTIITEPAIEFEAIADSSGQITIPDANLPIAFVESVKEKIIDGGSISYIDADYTEVDTTTLGSLTEGKKYKIVYHYSQELSTIPELEITYGMNTAATISSLVDVQKSLQEELGSVWITLLPLADKELAMYSIATVATDMSSDTFSDELKSKLNEILNVWKG